MSWRIAADLREIFTEVVATDGKRTVAARALNRKDQLASGFADALNQIGTVISPEMNRAEASVFLTSDLDRVALREHWGAPTAFVTTEGFENLIEIGDQRRENDYGLQALRAPPLISRDFSYGVTERTGADGNIEVGLDEKEIEFVASKLAMAEIKAVAISFLHSKANPHHEQQFASKLRDKGYEVVCSHQFEGNERERAIQACARALTLPGQRAFIDEIAKLGFSPDRVLMKTETVPHSLASLSNNSIAVEFLEDRIRVQGPGTKTFELSTHPLSTVNLDEGGLVHIGPAHIESEPGPVTFGKGLELSVLDTMALAYKLSASNLNRLKIDFSRTSKHLAPIAKQLQLDLDTCAKKYTLLAFEHVALEIRRRLTFQSEKTTMIATGWLASLMAPPVARQLGVRKIVLPQGFNWQPAQRLLDGEPSPVEPVSGVLTFEGASDFAEGIMHEL